MSEEYLLNYLNKNYTLKTGDSQYWVSDYCVLDILNNILFDSFYSFKKIVGIIIPCDNLDIIINKWYLEQSKIKDKEISDYLKILNYKIGVTKLIDNAFKYFSENKTFGNEFLIGRITQIYFGEYIKPKLERYYKKINTSQYLEYWTSKFLKTIHFKNTAITNLIIENITNYYEKNILINKIDELFINYDLTLRSHHLYNQMIKEMFKDFNIFKYKSLNCFNKNYREKYLNNLIYSYIDTLNLDVTSKDIINNFKYLEFETEENKEYIIKILNEWYQNNNQLEKKIDEIFGQLIIRLGVNTWEVYRIGYGLINENNLFEAFHEHEFHNSYILKRYDAWFKEAVIIASQALMSEKSENFYKRRDLIKQRINERINGRIK